MAVAYVCRRYACEGLVGNTVLTGCATRRCRFLWVDLFEPLVILGWIICWFYQHIILCLLWVVKSSRSYQEDPHGPQKYMNLEVYKTWSQVYTLRTLYTSQVRIQKSTFELRFSFLFLLVVSMLRNMGSTWLFFPTLCLYSRWRLKRRELHHCARQLSGKA